MKAFRGTLVMAVALVALAIIVLVARPDLLEGDPEGPPQIFAFEKHEVVRVEVQRPDGSTVALVETDGRWSIEGTDFQAGRSMVNRVKHQLHDLTARATVVEDPEQPELYGLGDNAIKVTLELRSGDPISFLAGDPNPSSVSYYLQPLPGDVVYTVKKSAVDYYSLTLDEFRERRFATFDSKDVNRVEASLDLQADFPDAAAALDIERVGDREWEMRQPLVQSASDDKVRRLIGRVSALKAADFVELDGDSDSRLSEFGLDAPRAVITITFASRDPLVVRVGNNAQSDNKYEELAYMRLGDDETVYVARRGMLKEFAQSADAFRNPKVTRMKFEDVVSVDATLRASADRGEDLEGQQGVRFAAEQWLWKDGVPVAGSTPERVARTLAEVEAQDFVADEATDLAPFGLDEPLARIVLADAESNERVVLLGNLGDPEVDPEGNERPRRYFAIEGDPAVYLSDDRSMSVVRDLIREGNRKAKKDLEKLKRRERIESVADEDEGATP